MHMLTLCIFLLHVAMPRCKLVCLLDSEVVLPMQTDL
jgi:hypothetical protein